ncbi:MULTISPECIES: TetR/AcrR family transcriptional regulator [unclassified Rossellomorea]|uniref:TetR/AcrR family transcriptional regulator n=1 Tax=unclassified Rossellomorea TaxID=2837526 RepID=UPI002630A801|nr:TetR/AcrR family transcriptional regulator [uncultured Rossellomorea sp.]
MDGFKARTDKKRELIIQSALVLFKSFSPSKVSIREIAGQAKVSVVTIYNYFGNKEGLMLEVVRLVLSNQLHVAEEITQSDDSTEEKIAGLIFTKNELLSQFHPDFISFIMNDPQMKELIEQEFITRTYELITAFINDAKSEGTISNEVPNDIIMKIIELYRKDVSSEQSILFSDPKDVKKHDVILRILMYGISGYRE